MAITYIGGAASPTGLPGIITYTSTAGNALFMSLPYISSTPPSVTDSAGNIWNFVNGLNAVWIGYVFNAAAITHLTYNTGKESSITNVSESSGSVVTATAANSFVGGEVIALAGFTGATWLNNQQASVSFTGLSGSQFQFTDPTSHGVYPSTSDTGVAVDSGPGCIAEYSGIIRVLNTTVVNGGISASTGTVTQTVGSFDWVITAWIIGSPNPTPSPIATTGNLRQEALRSAGGDTWAVLADNSGGGTLTCALSFSPNSNWNVVSIGISFSDFSVTLSPNPQTVICGNSSIFSVTVNQLFGYIGTVDLSFVSGLPTDGTYSFGSTSVSVPPGTTTLTITTDGILTPTGSTTLVVQGTDGTFTHTGSAVLNTENHGILPRNFGWGH